LNLRPSGYEPVKGPRKGGFIEECSTKVPIFIKYDNLYVEI